MTTAGADGKGLQKKIVTCRYGVLADGIGNDAFDALKTKSAICGTATDKDPRLASDAEQGIQLHADGRLQQPTERDHVEAFGDVEAPTPWQRDRASSSDALRNRGVG